MAVTIKDVAALAGVSPSTVSRTCKNNPSISKETKERVRRAMAELGYEPNFQASNLAAQISRSIGIILPPSPKETYENSFYLETIRGISHYCNAHQYISTIVTGQNEEEILNAVRSMSRSGKVDGFIVLYSRVNDPVIDFLFSEGLLYILIGKPAQYTNHTIYIDNDNLLAGQEATEYLYALGHRKIAYLSSSLGARVLQARHAAFLRSMHQHGLKTSPAAIGCSYYLSECMEKHLPRFLENGITAIICNQDTLASATLTQCQQLGFQVPDDISIIGFDDLPIAACTSPPLTTIRQDRLELGKSGFFALSSLFNHIPISTYLLHAQLIQRESTRKIPL